MRALRALAVLGTLAALAAPAAALTVQAQLTFGSRELRDGRIRSIYGRSEVFNPAVRVYLGPRLFIGAEYEGAESRPGTIGAYEERARFRLTGVGLSAGYRIGTRLLSVYARGGPGLYRAEQTIPGNPFAEARPVKTTSLGAAAALGLEIHPLRFFYLTGEARYVLLNVRPYDEKVNLSGLRLLAGFGLSL